MSLKESEGATHTAQDDKLNPSIRDHADGLGLDVAAEADVDKKLAEIEAFTSQAVPRRTIRGVMESGTR